MCRSGEIGKRRGLKILRRQLLAGSIPAFGTIDEFILPVKI